MQLDKATAQAGEASKLDELLSALEETMAVNDFLLNFDQLEAAISALTKNRVSTAHAAKACAAIFDRILKLNTTIPSATALQEVLDKPPAGALLVALPTSTRVRGQKWVGVAGGYRSIRCVCSTAVLSLHCGVCAARPKAEDVFFQGKSREIKTLTSILALMVKSGEQACLQVCF